MNPASFRNGLPRMARASGFTMAHNAFFGVTYNNGWIAGILLCAYTALAFVPVCALLLDAPQSSPYAATPAGLLPRCSSWWACLNRFTRRFP